MTFSHPHFAEPEWLWLAVLGPIFLFALQRFSAWQRNRQLARLVSPHFVSELTRSHSPLRRALKEALLILAIAAIGLAMARPQWGEQREASRLLGQDVVFVVDCSRSMLATDVSPSRLQRAKLAVLDFVQRTGHGRVGLVAFAGQAFLQCPLTYDYSDFYEAVTMLDDKTIPVPGTDVGRALDEGFQSLEKNSRQKLLVLITDGEDLEKGAVRTAETLAKEKVVIFCVGVGTAAGAEIQYINELGQPQIVRDNKGEVVRSRLDEPTLRNIAQTTHGAYFALGSLGEGLARTRLAIEDMGRSFGARAGRKFGVDRFYVPLAACLLLLFLEPLIGTRRKLRYYRKAMEPQRV